MKHFLNTVIRPYFTSVASNCSIIGLCIVVFSNKNAPQGYSEKAVFERKLIGQQIDSDYEYIESVEFNCLYKQYYHVVVDPLPGYIYRLRWTK